MPRNSTLEGSKKTSIAQVKKRKVEWLETSMYVVQKYTHKKKTAHFFGGTNTSTHLAKKLSLLLSCLAWKKFHGWNIKFRIICIFSFSLFLLLLFFSFDKYYFRQYLVHSHSWTMRTVSLPVEPCSTDSAPRDSRLVGCSHARKKYFSFCRRSER